MLVEQTESNYDAVMVINVKAGLLRVDARPGTPTGHGIIRLRRTLRFNSSQRVLDYVGRSGWALFVSVATALIVVPVERIACSIFFSVVAKGS